MFHIHRWTSLGRFGEAKYCRCGAVRYNPEEWHKSQLLNILSKGKEPMFTDEEMATLKRLVGQ